MARPHVPPLVRTGHPAPEPAATTQPAPAGAGAFRPLLRSAVPLAAWNIRTREQLGLTPGDLTLHPLELGHGPVEGGGS
ncbi:hypothetical protein ACFWXK_10415 [Streptomyces sp. NPDC059070]|uniref:hypothetical protein n=1 Tax=Streptomyces sp. NPDC059070 TaxID=3346713 RepID=UPI0036A29D53